MSEEKLYMVKNDEGEFLSFSDDGDSVWDKALGHFETDKQEARSWAHHRDGHVVTLIEEPEKVVLTKEQAEIVEEAHEDVWPATYISDNASSDDEELLMNAYVNGHTVEKEKKYLVYKTLGGKQNKDSHTGYAQACRALSNSETMFWVLTKWIINDKGAKFTEKEISDYGLQDCEKVWCDSDD